MKKILFPILLLIVVNSYSQWHYQNPIYTDTHMGYILFSNDQNGKILLNNGDYLTTTDSGDNWELTMRSPKIHLGGFFFLNENVGWAASDGSHIYKTTDGGITWTQQRFDAGQKGSINYICFINENKGFAIGTEGKIWVSYNGGADWEHKWNTSSKLYGIKFRDENDGFLLSEYGTYYRTTDGGESWNSSNTGVFKTLRSIQFFGDDTVYIHAASNRLLKSYNGGHSFLEKQMALGAYSYGLNFLTPDVGFVFGNNGMIKKTTDGGDTWEDMSVELSPDLYLYGSHFFDENHAICTGMSGYLFKMDNGTDWREISHGSRSTMYDIEFLDGQKGYTVGLYGHINETDNGGKNWYHRQLPTDQTLLHLEFISNQEYMICGTQGTLAFSANMGEYWDVINTPSDDMFSATHFWDAQNGIILGHNSGTIYTTSDTGATLNEVYSNDSLRLKDIHFVDNMTGFVVCQRYSGYSGTLLRTEDAGASWSIIKEVEEILLNIDFYGEKGVAVGAGGTVLITDDGGNTWNEYNTGENLDLGGVCFGNENILWASANYGRMYKSTDGGYNWTKLEEFTKTHLYDIFAANDTTVWATGLYGTIINRGIENSVDIEDIPRFKEPTIVRNYPNPFREYTHITLDLVTLGTALIHIYDIQGKLVDTQETVVNQSGVQQIRINGSTLEKGFYLFTVTNGNSKHQGKFIVM